MSKSWVSNSSNYSYNILSNRENLDEKKKKIIDGIKVDLFETMKMDKIMVDRNDLAHSIDENRKNSWVWRPRWKIRLNDSFKGKEIDEKKYADILWKYDNIIKDKEDKNLADDDPKFNEELRKLDTQLAERIILDQWGAVEFKSIDKYGDWKTAEEESKTAYKNLNTLVTYQWKIDLVSRKEKQWDKDIDYFVIKWKPSQIKKIQLALKAIDDVSKMRDQDIESLKIENNDNVTELTKKLEESEKKRKIENENNKKTIEELKKKLEDVQKSKDKMGYKERQIQLLEQKNAELKVQLQQMLSNKWWVVIVEWQELKVTEELIDATKRQININDKKIKELRWVEGNERNEENDIIIQNMPWLKSDNEQDEKQDHISTDDTDDKEEEPKWSTDDTDDSEEEPKWSIDDGEDGWEWSQDDGDGKFEQRERVATISNVNQVNRAICQREADEELRDRYKNLKWRNIFDRANLFIRRKYIKDRLVNEKMWWRKWFDWSESGQSAADRHQIEQQNDFADRMKVVIQDIDSKNYPETRRRLDELLGRLTWKPTTVPPRQRWISDTQFQTEFQNIMNQSGKIFDKTRPWTATSTNWRPISEIIRSNDMDQLSTNILMQANKFREQQFMTWSIADHIAKNPTENRNNFDVWCRWVVSKYINTYNDVPDFLHQMNISLDDKEATKEIRRLQAHDGALTMIQAQSLKLRIQMLDDGWEAYNVKKTGWLLTKIGRFLDDPTWWENTKFGKWMNKHPNLKEAFGRVWWATKIGVMVTPWLLLAPYWALAVAGGVWWMSFLTTLFKKKSHYEKEHRSYQRMQATNLEDYRQKREQLANEVAWMKWYEWRFWWEKAKIREQYRDYVKTTQDQLSLSNDLVSKIESRLQDRSPLTDIERTNLAADVAEWLARLDYHKNTGQNFLWSNQPGVAEKEYRALQNAVMWWARRLRLVDAQWNPDMNIIRTRSPYDAYYNATTTLIEEWTWDEYNTQWYLKARKRFKRRSNGKARRWALKAWSISFALSYLASSLASHDKVKEIDTYTNKSSWSYWWEYHLWDVDESLLIPWSSPTWSVNPEMYLHINWSTSEITWCQLYSSVDAVRCSAAKWASELAAAQSDLATALSNPIVAWNPDLVSAVSNYVADVTTKVWMIPWLDAWNHDLLIARAYEVFNKWILDPIIASSNASVVVNPTWFTRVNWWVQASSVWAVWQSFRNMWIIWLDYIQHWTEQVVEHVTRAIPIPVWLNTFWAPKSDPHKQWQNKGKTQKSGKGQ